MLCIINPEIRELWDAKATEIICETLRTVEGEPEMHTIMNVCQYLPYLVLCLEDSDSASLGL